MHVMKVLDYVTFDETDSIQLEITNSIFRNMRDNYSICRYVDVDGYSLMNTVVLTSKAVDSHFITISYVYNVKTKQFTIFAEMVYLGKVTMDENLTADFRHAVKQIRKYELAVSDEVLCAV